MINECRTRTEIRDGKYIKVARQRKHGVNKSKNNYSTAAIQQTNSIVVPIWQKAALTIEEAAIYSNISSKTLRRFINECTPDFILKIGTKTLIKRKIFEKFLERTDAI